MKGYKRVELGDRSDRRRTRDASICAPSAGWRDATEVSFYGVGGDTTAEAKSNFRMQQAYVGARVPRPRPRARSSSTSACPTRTYTLESGTGASPSIEDVYTPETAPGLGDSPDVRAL